MQEKTYSHTDMESLLPGYFKGTLSVEEEQKVEAWIAADPRHREIACKAGRIGQIASGIDVGSTLDTDNALMQCQRNIRRNKVWQRTRTISSCVAAASLAALAAVLIWNSRHFESTNIEIKTVAGMVSHTTLPDGSEVWLNSNSTLCYPASFGNGDRAVSLDGEGYFKVAKRNGKKFTVSAGNTTIEVKGTEFNVEAYSEKHSGVTTTLVSGSVVLGYNDLSGRSHSVIMKPGETYTYDKSTDRLVSRQRNPIVETSWKDGKLIFDNTSLSDALRLIENRFNIRFLIRNEKLLENTYTGTFTDQKLDVIFDYFKRTTDMHFEYEFKNIDDNFSGRQTIIIH